MIVSNHTNSPLSASDLAAAQSNLSKSLSRLNASRSISSPAANDAADLPAGAQRDAQFRNLDDAAHNIGHAMSYVQTQDAYLKKISQALEQMSQLAEAAQDDTASEADTPRYQNEFSRLSRFISDVPAKEFDGISLFSGDALEVTIDLQGTTLALQGVSLGTAAYTDVVNATLDSVAAARDTLDKLKDAILQVARDRAAVSADQSQLSTTAEQLIVNKENLTAASSRIQSEDVANVSTESARRKILMQSGTAILAQANAMPDGALRLLR